jgi:hypothetical protein
MNWTAEHARDIREKSWTLFPRRLPPALVERARALIAEDFARDPPADDEACQRCARGTFCLRLVEAGALDFLVRESGVLAFAAEAIDHLQEGLRAQVARRRRGDAGVPHIDGFYPADDGPANTPDAIIGIYLTDVTRREQGAFTVWPKARARIGRWARGLKAVPNRSAGHPRLDRIGPGSALLGRKGTIFLVHGALPHCNLRRETRGYRDAVFFRLYRCQPHRDVLRLLRSGGVEW